MILFITLQNLIIFLCFLKVETTTLRLMNPLYDNGALYGNVYAFRVICDDISEGNEILYKELKLSLYTSY